MLVSASLPAIAGGLGAGVLLVVLLLVVSLIVIIVLVMRNKKNHAQEKVEYRK